MKESPTFDRKDWVSAYCNVEQELENIQLKLIKGVVPKEIKGTFYRNGPGRLERAGRWVHHPFDGDGMIASFKFKEGKVNFTNKFVRTKGWDKEESAGKFIYRGVFGTQKEGGPLANAFDLRLKNIANTNVIKFGNQLLALWEADNPHSLDPTTLETLQLSNLNGILKKGEPFSAHPRFDPGHFGSPKMVTFSVQTGPKSTIRLMEFGIKDSDQIELLNSRKDKFNGFAFLHDFAITPNWAIFLQNAIDFNPLPFIFGTKGAAQCITKSDKKKAYFLLIPRKNGKFSGQLPRKINAPDGFVFHHLNAFEKGENIILDSIFYNEFPTIHPNESFREIDFENLPEGILKRSEIDIKKNNVNTIILSHQCCEFAMVNPFFQGLNATFSWMAVTERMTGNAPLQAIKKLNLTNGNNYLWSCAPKGFVGEPIMVPKHKDANEDDGWILTLAWNGEKSRNNLIILNATTLEEVAILEVPIKIPHGLHGFWSED